MATQKAWDEKPTGRPTRQCENCGKFYFPRLKECPGCGARNPTVGGAPRRKMKRRAVRRGTAARGAAARGTAARRGDALDAAVDFVRAAGGMENARAALDRIERIRRL